MSKILHSTIFSLMVLVTFLVQINQSRANGKAETFYHGDQSISTIKYSQQYDDDVYLLYSGDYGFPDYSTHTGTPDYYFEIEDDDNTWKAEEHMANGHQVALDAHFGMGIVQKFLFTEWQNSHITPPHIKSFINVCCKDGGAVYDHASNSIKFHIASDDQPYSLGTYIDVIAHEHLHAILANQGIVPGGISHNATVQESLADIFSALLQNYYNKYFNDNDDVNIWMYSRYPNKHLRDMANPRSGIPEDPQPDTFEGVFWNDMVRHGSFDDLMYQNTGIYNHWAYLFSEGSSSTDQINDNGDSFIVVGQGIDQLSVWMQEFLSITAVDGIKVYDNRGWEELRDQFTQAAINSGSGSLLTNSMALTSVNASHAIGLFGPLKPPTNYKSEVRELSIYLSWENYVWDHAGYDGLWHENDMMGMMIVQRKACATDGLGPSINSDDVVPCSNVETIKSFDYLPWSKTPGLESTTVTKARSHKFQYFHRLLIQDFFGRSVVTPWF